MSPIACKKLSKIHTLGSRPSANLASEVNADDLGALKLPRDVRHHVDRISASDTAGNHTETTSIRSVRVRTNHKSTRERVVLKDDLVDDARAGAPETHTVLKIACQRKDLKKVEDTIRTFAVAVAKKS